jgi:DnaJ-domain-containing protein 1
MWKSCVRAFVRLRQLLASNSKLAKRLDSLERKYDRQFSVVFDAIRALMAEADDDADKPRIGYETERKTKGK